MISNSVAGSQLLSLIILGEGLYEISLTCWSSRNAERAAFMTGCVVPTALLTKVSRVWLVVSHETVWQALR